MKVETVQKQTCQRCEHQWFPRESVLPVVCPKCKSPYWQTKAKAKTKK